MRSHLAQYDSREGQGAATANRRVAGPSPARGATFSAAGDKTGTIWRRSEYAFFLMVSVREAGAPDCGRRRENGNRVTSRWVARLALCRTAVTSAWSLCAAASSGLRPSRAVCSRLRPSPTVPVVECASRCGPVVHGFGRSIRRSNIGSVRRVRGRVPLRAGSHYHDAPFRADNTWPNAGHIYASLSIVKSGSARMDCSLGPPNV